MIHEGTNEINTVIVLFFLATLLHLQQFL